MSWMMMSIHSSKRKSCCSMYRISSNSSVHTIRRVASTFSTWLATGKAAGRRSFVSTATDSENPKTTHFGFQTVHEQEKKGRVAEVFHGVAQSYDVMNDFMSAGMHRVWKDAFVEMMGLKASCQTRGGRMPQILDVAGGTGDIAFRMAHDMKNGMTGETRSTHSRDASLIPTRLIKEDKTDHRKNADAQADITICDINSSMLRVGQDRAQTRKLGVNGSHPTLHWVEGDAEKLQFASNSFDLYTIAFGIRNVTHVNKALDEAYRVLRPGGRFMCLEFSQVHNPLLKQVYDAYSFNVIPKLGEIVAKDRDSYQYLVESIRQFPEQETFKQMIQAAGFSYVTYTDLTFGVVSIHSGFKCC